jgi:predicted lysophospholipase L1 biosynthesis ABC-type transport system permease subunit
MQPLTDTERENLRGSLTTLRIIVFALLLGVTAYTGFSVFTQLQKAPQPPQPAPQAQWPITHVVSLGFGALFAVIALVLPPFIAAPKIETEKTDPREVAIVQAAGTVQMRTIIGCAILEGAAFFNAIWVQMDFSLPNLAMVGVLVFLLLLHFPLAGWYYGKVERLMGVDPFAMATAYAPRKNLEV